MKAKQESKAGNFLPNLTFEREEQIKVVGFGAETFARPKGDPFEGYF